MRVEVYKCENCGKQSSYYEKGWIHISKEGLKITGDKIKGGLATINRSCSLIFAEEGWELDFCSLKCFIKWLYLSIDTDNGVNYDKNIFLKEAIRTIIEDEFLKGLIVDCLDLKSEGN